jgi:hypothetical protein
MCLRYRYAFISHALQIDVEHIENISQEIKYAIVGIFVILLPSGLPVIGRQIGLLDI